MKMKNAQPAYIKSLISWLIPFFLFCLPTVSYAHVASTYHVLILHSYNKGLEWTDNIQKGIESVFEPVSDQLELQVEYMDSKIVKFDETFKTRLYDLYKHKFSTSQFNVIISSDDNALNFLREYHKDLFPETPVVFCGVNNFHILNIVDRSMFTGILEITAERETLDLILQLHPQTKKLVIVCGSTPSGNARWKQIERMFKYYPQLQFSRIDSSYSMAEIEEKVKKLPDDTIGIFATLYRDKLDQYFSLKEAVERVSSASRRPLYTYHAQVLQHGTVGGKVLGGFQHGRLAAELAQRIYQGESTVDIPIIDTSLAQYMFNYRELERLGIDLSKLPENSTIINRPFSFYEEYKNLVWATFIVTLFLVTIIFMLVLTITKRKQVERSLRSSQITLKEKEEQVRLLLDSTAEAIYGMDLDGCCTFCNPRCLEFLGYDREEELLGKNMHSLIYQSKSDNTENPVTERAINEVFKNKVGIHVTEELLFKADGTSFWAEYWSYPTIKDNEIVGAVVSFIDISDRKKEKEEKKMLNTQLQQAQKMESIGTLAGGIAHDFNNILTPIFGYLELAMLKTTADSDLANYLVQIQNAAERAKEMVKQILTFSRRDSEDIFPIQVHIIVKEALKLLRASIPSTIDIKQNIDSNCGTVLASPTQIHQTLMNLCTNAYQAMRETVGILEVSLIPIEISAKDFIKNITLKPGPYLRLEVSDTGHGMDKATQERIFEPYFSTKANGEGTGMGLSVVHGIVTGLGGHIRVRSEQGKGSTFQIYLPVHESSISQTFVFPEGPVPTGTERIMLVDDEESVVNVEEAMLTGLGYEVKAFTSPLEALEHFTLQPDAFDLLITDMTMPKMTGDELALEIMAIRPDIPVILCTGFNDLVNKETVKAMGIREYVTKPMTIHSFGLAVRTVLDGV